MSDKNAVLGNSTNIPSNQQITVISADHKARSRRLKHQSKAKYLLKDAGILSARKNRDGEFGIHRIRKCFQSRKHNVDSITIKLSENSQASSASFSGAAACGCIWGCPVCAPKISTQKQKEVSYVFDWWTSNGGVILLAHFTASHSINMSLDFFKTKFKKAWDYFASGGGWKSLRETSGLQHYIANTEPLYNDINGWHYHKHAALLFNFSMLAEACSFDEIETLFRTRWMSALDRAGLSGIGEIAFKLTADGDMKDHYLTKLTINEDDLTASPAHEIAASGTKEKSTGRSCWQLLEDAYNGDVFAGEKYCEFVDAMGNDKWLHTSKNLWIEAGVEFMDDDEAAALDDENEKKMLAWMAIDDDDWSNIRYWGAHGQVLDVAATTREKDRVHDYLEHLRVERNKIKNSPLNYARFSEKQLIKHKEKLRGLIQKNRQVKHPKMQKRVNYWSACLKDIFAELDKREIARNPLFRKD